MEVSGWPHAFATEISHKRAPLCRGLVGCQSQFGCSWKREKSHAPARIQTPDYHVALAAIPSRLSDSLRCIILLILPLHVGQGL